MPFAQKSIAFGQPSVDPANLLGQLSVQPAKDPRIHVQSRRQYFLNVVDQSLIIGHFQFSRSSSRDLRVSQPASGRNLLSECVLVDAACAAGLQQYDLLVLDLDVEAKLDPAVSFDHLKDLPQAVKPNVGRRGRLDSRRV